MGIFKTENDYQKLLSRGFYGNCPKAVFAALAVSYLLNHQNVNAENVEIDLRREWSNLHSQGIIPQKPPNSFT